MSRDLSSRRRRALRHRSLEALEARALLTASPGTIDSGAIIPPTAAVSPATSETSSGMFASGASANASAAPGFNSGGASSVSESGDPAAGNPAAIPPDGDGSNSGGSDPADPTSNSGSSDGSGGRDPAGDALKNQADRIKANLETINRKYAADQQKIGQDRDRLNATKATISGLEDEQFRIAETLATGSQDGSSDSQMVAAYLENEIQVLQKEIDGLNAALEPLEAAVDQDAADLLDDVTMRNGYLDDLATLRNNWVRLRNSPPPF